MNTQHTPGPLHVEPDQPSHGCSLCIVTEDGEVIARTPAVPHYGHPDQAQDEANAQRIVACVNACEGINPEAVPDLLAALELVRYIEAAHEEGNWDDMDWPSIIFQMRAALAKATGQESGVAK